MNQTIVGDGNLQANNSTVNMIVGDSVFIQMNAREFRALVADAEKYRELGEEIIQHAEKWEALHPKAQEAIEDCNYCPSQILP